MLVSVNFVILKFHTLAKTKTKKNGQACHIQFDSVLFVYCQTTAASGHFILEDKDSVAIYNPLIRNLVKVGRKNSLLTGRNFRHYQALEMREKRTARHTRYRNEYKKKLTTSSTG